VAGGDGADAAEELQEPEPAHRVAGVGSNADQGEEVFDLGCFQVADAAVLDERDAPAAEFELEQVGVVGGTHQHGLIAQPDGAFVVGKHSLGDQAGFLCLIAPKERRSSKLDP
jgi:hypothetical protein